MTPDCATVTLAAGGSMSVNVPDTALCRNCGYALRGLPNPICPECGLSFDPEKPETYRDPARLTKRQEQLLRYAGPPPLWQAILAIIVALPILYLQSTPHFMARGKTMLQPFSAASYHDSLNAALSVLFIIYLFRFLALLGTRGLPRSPSSLSPRRVWLQWVVMPACFLAVALGAIASDRLVTLRFAVSRPAIERAMQPVQATGKPDMRTQWLGLLRVERIVRLDGKRIQITLYKERHLVCGIIYDPNPPAILPPSYDGQLADHWFLKSW